jgi:drug/metabolite transporter (DMT)-like permease
MFRKKLPHDLGTLAKLTIYCLIYVSMNTAQIVGLVRESSGIGAVITYTQPLLVLCLSSLFLNEKITANKILGVAVDSQESSFSSLTQQVLSLLGPV